MFRIAHVSDIHASGRWFDQAAFDAGVERVNALGVDRVVFTGDLTDEGVRSEFDGAAALLDGFEAPLVSVMGNHDAKRDGWRLFAERLCGGSRYYEEEWGEVRFIGLDSAEPDVHEGHIGREQMAWFEGILERQESQRDPRPVVVALHHHVIPVPGTGRERNILLDAGDFLRALDRHAVPLVLTGHKHQPWAWRINDTIIATTGTLSSRKTTCGQNFNLIALDGRTVEVTNIDATTGAEKRLGRWELPHPRGPHAAGSTATAGGLVGPEVIA